MKVLDFCKPGRNLLANQFLHVLIELVPIGSEEDGQPMDSVTNHVGGKQLLNLQIAGI